MHKPNLFYATYICGNNIGALDVERTIRKEMAQLLGKWLMDGCTVTPMFGSTVSVYLSNCTCKKVKE